jgi:hypothetical protein
MAAVQLRTEALADLLATARHEASIYERRIDGDVFDNGRVLAAIRALATGGRGSRIRLLVHDTDRIQVEAPRLLALAQRLTSSIAIRSPCEAPDTGYASAFTLVDAGGLLFRPEADRHDARAAGVEVGEHARLQSYFDAVWERSTPAAALRRIDICAFTTCRIAAGRRYN